MKEVNGKMSQAQAAIDSEATGVPSIRQNMQMCLDEGRHVQEGQLLSYFHHFSHLPAAFLHCLYL